MQNDWFSNPNPTPSAKLNVFSFTFAGGSSYAYNSWSPHLSKEVDFFTVVLPGRDKLKNEPFYQSIDTAVEELFQKIKSKMDKPFILYGHSLGAILAYEMAAKIEELGNKNSLKKLVVSGRRAPNTQIQHAPFNQLSYPEKINKIRSLGGTPEQVLTNKELMDYLMPTFEADFILNENYRFTKRPPLHVPIVAFYGKEDSFNNKKEIEDWRTFSNTSSDVHWLDGGHFFVLDKQTNFVGYLNRQFEAVISETQILNN